LSIPALSGSTRQYDRYLGKSFVNSRFMLKMVLKFIPTLSGPAGQCDRYIGKLFVKVYIENGV
jgi:hypothetical protein